MKGFTNSTWNSPCIVWKGLLRFSVTFMYHILRTQWKILWVSFRILWEFDLWFNKIEFEKILLYNNFHAQYSFWSMYRFQKVLILIKFIWVFPNFFLNHDKSSKEIQESFNLNVKEFLMKLWLKRCFCLINIFHNLSYALRILAPLGCKPCQPHATELLKHFFERILEVKHLITHWEIPNFLTMHG